MNNRFWRFWAALLGQTTNLVALTKVGRVFFSDLSPGATIHFHIDFDRINMVAGLKQGKRVQGYALKVFGQQKATLLFPKSWKNQIVHGVVTKKDTGRKVIVAWDSIDETCSVSSRLLDHEEQQQAN